MKERVLICKETGELHLLTNKTESHYGPLSMVFLLFMLDGEIYGVIDWHDDMFEDLGEL